MVLSVGRAELMGWIKAEFGMYRLVIHTATAEGCRSLVLRVGRLRGCGCMHKRSVTEAAPAAIPVAERKK